MSTDFFADLVKTRTVKGRPATLADYDEAIKKASDTYAWAVRHGLDTVAALATGTMAALIHMSPPRLPPY